MNRSPVFIAFSLALVAGALAACSASLKSAAPQLSDLQGIPDSYRMRVMQECYCPEEFIGPFDVVVRNGAAVSVTDTRNGKSVPVDYVGDEIPSLALVLRYINDADPDKVHAKEVRWHHAPWVPAYVFIDYSDRIADEEIRIQIEEFELL